MNDQFMVSPLVRRNLSVLLYVSFLIIGLISILDILGWIFDLPILKAFSRTWKPMMPATVFCFVLSVVALVFLAIGLTKYLKLIAGICGLIISLVGLQQIFFYSGLFKSVENYPQEWLLQLDLLFKPDLRMSGLTAIIFIFTGIIITLLSYNSRKIVNIAHFLVFLPFSLGYLVIMSYILDVPVLREIQSVPVALNTGIAFFFLSIALLTLHPESWLMRSFTSNFAGSLMARRLLPGLILLPLIIGWFRIRGENAGIFPSDVGVVLVAMTYTLSFILLIWLTAKSVNLKDLERSSSEAKLQASKDRYATTLSSIGDAVIATDIEGKITFLNRIGEQVTGWSFEEALNKPVKEVFQIINEQTRLEVENPVEQVLKKGTIVGLANHTLLVRKDGSEIPIDDSGAPIFGPNGLINGVVLVFRDISERRKSEKLIYENEQRLRFHFENSPLAVVEWDADYIVTQWSIEAERLFGWTREETLGKNIGSINMIFEEDFPIVENTMKRLSGGLERTVVVTNRNYTKKGKIIECTWFNSVLVNESGEMGSVMSLVLDITEMKAAQKQILAANQELIQFNKAMVGRELRMIELKNEVNKLCAKAGLPPVYKIETEEVHHENR